MCVCIYGRTHQVLPGVLPARPSPALAIIALPSQADQLTNKLTHYYHFEGTQAHNPIILSSPPPLSLSPHHPLPLPLLAPSNPLSIPLLQTL